MISFYLEKRGVERAIEGVIKFADEAMCFILECKRGINYGGKGR